MPIDPDTKESKGEAFIHLVHPVFVSKLRTTLAEPPLWGVLYSGPAVQTPKPNPQMGQVFAQKASDGHMLVRSKTAEAARGLKLRKTKLCVFFNINDRCLLGSSCQFAHSHAELQAPPDLTKTRPCYNFYRNKCHDPDCRHAHGRRELRRQEVAQKDAGKAMASTTGERKPFQ